MTKSSEQKIMQQGAKVKILEIQRAFIEQQAFLADKKAIIFDILIDIAEKKYQINMRKNASHEQFTILKKNKS